MSKNPQNKLAERSFEFAVVHKLLTLDQAKFALPPTVSYNKERIPSRLRCDHGIHGCSGKPSVQNQPPIASPPC